MFRHVPAIPVTGTGGGVACASGDRKRCKNTGKTPSKVDLIVFQHIRLVSLRDRLTGLMEIQLHRPIGLHTACGVTAPFQKGKGFPNAVTNSLL